MHLDETAAAAALRQLRPLLRPGARLLIDVDHPLALSAAGNEPDFELEEELRDEAMGETIRQYAAYESVPGEQAVDVTWVYETGQENAEARTQVTMRYHYLYPHQYDLLLSLTGFRLLGSGRLRRLALRRRKRAADCRGRSGIVIPLRHHHQLLFALPPGHRGGREFAVEEGQAPGGQEIDDLVRLHSEGRPARRRANGA